VTPADRLRQQAAELLQIAAALDATMAAASDSGASESDENFQLVSLREASRELGCSYDALRIRAARAHATVSVGSASYVRRHWLSAQIRNVRSVRSVAEHSPGETESRCAHES
jgi:hypothetical protein